MVITFVTPPGRPSVLRANTVQEAKAQQADASTAGEHGPKPLTNALRHTNSEPQPVSDADQVLEHEPLTFQKRILPHLTTSPEPVVESFDLPQSRKSLDGASSHNVNSGEAKKPSLLSTAMVASSAQPPRSASTTNLGILRRAESKSVRSSLDAVSRATGDASDSTTAAPRPRLHFIEPNKQPHSHLTARHDAAVPTSSAKDTDTATSKQALASTIAATAAPSQSAAEADPAPRKRSLVIQEHADVIERAAERAARQANHLSSQALEQHTRTGSSTRSRQHSASSAGEETASTRSSWALRSNSRVSSVGTSPSVVSDDNAQEPPELELSKPSELPPVVSIFSNTTTTDRDDAKLQTAPANPPRKLTFISPAPSKRRRSPVVNPVSPTSHHPDISQASSSKNVGALSDDQAPHDSSRRVLAFAACPKPQRAARLSPAHATRRPKSKLSASPAPPKLAYPQRLKGIRGSDPIRSPAPGRARLPLTQAADWEQSLKDVSSEGSGYSEDEEDGDTDEEEEEDDDDDDDALSQTNTSDDQSFTESVLEKSEESASLSHEHASLSSDDAVEELCEDGGATEYQVNRPSSRSAQLDHQADRHEGAALRRDSLPGPSQHISSRRSSGLLPDKHLTARAILAGQTSPPRPSKPSQSRHTSPLSGVAGSSSRKLKPRDSFSHPMCFLPDAFEDSAPPTPTEPDSDANDSLQRANLLPGWFSEGGSAASSRRASWQQPPPPASPRALSGGEEGSAVPITLPPFRRTRERTAQQGVMSDGEQNSRSLGGNAAFIRESAGLGRSPALHDHSAGASPRATAGPQALGISMPVHGRPTQPVSWRHLSSQHVPTPDRSSAAAIAYRRASHSMEPRKYSSAVTSPIGSYSHAHGAGRVASHLAGSERSVRPSVGKQRAVSTSSHIRSQPSVAPSMHDDVVIATSPPRDDASAHLKHHLAHSPKSPGYSDGQYRTSHASGSTTPGWVSDGQLPSQTTSRYWTERLSSLAQAMSEELSLAGNAVLGKDSKPAEVGGEGSHRRSRSVPLESAVLDEVSQEPQPDAVTNSRRSSVGVPQTQSSDAGGDEGKPFQVGTRHTVTDGSTRLVVMHTSNAAEANVGKVE